MGILRLSFSVSILLALSACGGSSAPPPAAPAPAETAPAAPAPAEGAKPPEAAPAAAAEPPPAPAAPAGDVWHDGMSKDEQVAFMKKNIVPHMEPVFKGYNAEHYAKFGCKTCHGPAFKEPKAFLPKLTFKDGNLTAFKEKPEIAKFMAEKVVPEMASAMGMKPYDPATKTGFGCGGCHEIKMK